jgi:hypothetical protein
MAYLIAGPLVALVGIVAVFFVLRRKSVEKRSMYSARRTQIEHKVRAARQRTLAGRGRAQHAASRQTMEAASPFAGTEIQPTVTYEAPAYQAPPVAPPPPSPNQWDQPAAPAAPPPWETTSAPPQVDYQAPASAPEQTWGPPAYEQPAPDTFQPAPEPTPMAPSQPAWTPAPAPASEPVAPLEPAASSSSSTAAGGWSIVSPEKEEAPPEQPARGKRGDKGAATGSSWELSSGEAPGMEEEEPEGKRPAGSVMAIAQYAVLVVGLVMVLIGVLVMVANSKVT